MWFEQVVNGSPISTMNTVDFNPFVLFGNFKDFWVNIKCIYGVVDHIIDGSDVDDLWHNVKIQMKAIVDIEWENCRAIKDHVEQEKYNDLKNLPNLKI